MDFSGFDRVSNSSRATDPLRIFDELPKAPGHNDLYNSQAQVLKEWHGSAIRDSVIKLHTGGGKTLVGLLIAQSIMAESSKPVLFLCPDNQLVDQTLKKAELYSIKALGYPDRGFPVEFENAEAILIAPYESLFNGQSRFGTMDGSKPIMILGGIVIDDAHAAFADLRDAFTFSVKSGEARELYLHLANLFREDFREIGKLGVFEDILGDSSETVIEVPYWAWQRKEVQIRKLLTDLPAKDAAGKLINIERFFKWPFLRDQLSACHALVSARAFTLAPILPLVNALPSYQNCPKRIFMSASVNDDSILVRTFNLDANYASLTPPGTTGIAERFIFSPAFTPNFETGHDAATRATAEYVSSTKSCGVVILTPSTEKSKSWANDSEVVVGNERVKDAIARLQLRATNGPIAFVNRYNGMDLPGDACRLVIMWEMPTGISDYDQYRASVLQGGQEIAASTARAIEQGMGRGARGASDFCIVLFAGRSIEAWIGKKSNLGYLSLATRIQIEIGRRVASTINSLEVLKSSIDQVLSRDKSWVSGQAAQLSVELEQANTQRARDTTSVFQECHAFDLLRKGRFQEACSAYASVASAETDKYYTAWLLQIAARCALYAGDSIRAETLQSDANKVNDKFPRPPGNRTYHKLTSAGSQASKIARILSEYEPPTSVIAAFDTDLALLNAQSSTEQFENSLSSLGTYLGFETQRPEKTDNIGPDVLWMDEKKAFVLEAKSRKSSGTKIAKKDVGQILTSADWFEAEYPGIAYENVIIAPNSAKESKFIATCRALTMANLLQIVADLRQVYVHAALRANDISNLDQMVEHALSTSRLSSRRLSTYFSDIG